MKIYLFSPAIPTIDGQKKNGQKRDLLGAGVIVVFFVLISALFSTEFDAHVAGSILDRYPICVDSDETKHEWLCIESGFYRATLLQSAVYANSVRLSDRGTHRSFHKKTSLFAVKLFTPPVLPIIPVLPICLTQTLDLGHNTGAVLVQQGRRWLWYRGGTRPQYLDRAHYHECLTIIWTVKSSRLYSTRGNCISQLPIVINRLVITIGLYLYPIAIRPLCENKKYFQLILAVDFMPFYFIKTHIFYFNVGNRLCPLNPLPGLCPWTHGLPSLDLLQCPPTIETDRHLWCCHHNANITSYYRPL